MGSRPGTAREGFARPIDSGGRSSLTATGLGFRLLNLTNAWLRAMNQALRPLGLTHSQFGLLRDLARMARRDSAITQAMLARASDADEMVTSQLARILESKSLLVRSPHPSDSRARILGLTPEGEDLVRRGRRVVRESDLRFFAPLRDSGAFAADLRRLGISIDRAGVD